MNVGLFFPSFRHWLDVPAARRLVEAAEAGGLDSLWVPDALLFSDSGNSERDRFRPMASWLKNPRRADDFEQARAAKPPHAMAGDAFRDSMVACGLLAGMTSLSIGTSVALVPYRTPFALARAVASLENLTQGRFLFGIGTGHAVAEYDILGLDYEQRFDLLEENVACMRALWGDEPAAFEGERWRFEHVRMLMPPRPRPFPPVLVGGNSKRVLRLAARLDAGWIPAWLEAEELARGVAYLREQRAELGHDTPPEVTMLKRLRLVRDEAEAGGEGRARYTPGRLTEELERLREAGCGRAVLVLPTVDLDVMLEQLELIGDAIGGL